MLSRKLVLTLIAIFFIVLFFRIETYNNWWRIRVWDAIDRIPTQLVYMEPEERLAMRFGNSYIISKNIAEHLKKLGAADTAVVLLPPKEFITKNNVDYPVPEPVVFYYYTGLQSLWTISSDVERCNYAVIIVEGKMQLIPVDPQQLQQILTEYKKYKAL
jgi:hypothetical protein